jgi:hypothetical protein
MTTIRPRRYLARPLFAIVRPLFRRSTGRDAYVLRVVGNSFGPVIRPDRRRAGVESFKGTDRRRSGAQAGGRAQVV